MDLFIKLLPTVVSFLVTLSGGIFLYGKLVNQVKTNKEQISLLENRMNGQPDFMTKEICYDNTKKLQESFKEEFQEYEV